MQIDYEEYDVNQKAKLIGTDTPAQKSRGSKYSYREGKALPAD
jgi:hypothetical protein